MHYVFFTLTISSSDQLLSAPVILYALRQYTAIVGMPFDVNFDGF